MPERNFVLLWVRRFIGNIDRQCWRGFWEEVVVQNVVLGWMQCGFGTHNDDLLPEGIDSLQVRAA